MSTTATRLHTGDVIEIDVDGAAVSAIVLLASGDAVILDACDGSTPFVVRLSDLRDLGDVRVFDPSAEVGQGTEGWEPAARRP
jgi:hypothetical protein